MVSEVGMGVLWLVGCSYGRSDTFAVVEEFAIGSKTFICSC